MMMSRPRRLVVATVLVWRYESNGTASQNVRLLTTSLLRFDGSRKEHCRDHHERQKSQYDQREAQHSYLLDPRRPRAKNTAYSSQNAVSIQIDNSFANAV